MANLNVPDIPGYQLNLPQKNVTDLIEKASEAEEFIRNIIEINTKGREGIDFIWIEITPEEAAKLKPIDRFDIREIINPESGTQLYYRRTYKREDWEPSIEDNNLAIWLEEKIRFILNPSTLIRNTKDVNKELRNISIDWIGELFLLKTNPNPRRRIKLDGPTFVRLTDALDNILTSVYLGTTTSSAHISNKEATISMNQVSISKNISQGEPQRAGIGAAIQNFLPGAKEVLPK